MPQPPQAAKRRASGPFRALLALTVAATLLASRPAGAADAPLVPVVETGVHEAPINAMAPLAAGGGFVTVSDDKTARVWRSDGTEAVGVIRPPIGAGDDGALYAVATSAKVIAVAGRVPAGQGRTQFGIAFYSAVDFQPLGLISGFTGAVLAMKMAPAGDRLAVGTAAGVLLVYDLKTRKVDLDDKVFPGKITSLDFDPTGRLAVAGDDNTVRLYDGGLRLLAAMPLRAGARAYGIAFSPDGSKLAAGDRAKPVVHLFDTRAMRFERDLEGAPGRQGGFTTVAFSTDGGTLYAAGSYIDPAYTLNIRRWPMAGGGAAVDIPAAKDLVTALVPDGNRLLYATAEPVLGVVDEAGRAQVLQAPRHIDFHDRARTSIRLSRTGGTLEIVRGTRALTFDVATREFSRDAARDLAQPSAAGFGMTVTDWRDGRAPKVNGQPVKLEPDETARSAAVSPAGAVLGTDFFVRFRGRDGLAWKMPTGSPAWAVHASADGRVVVAGLGDGTVHWYNATDGRELVALFIDPATERFVEWTPEGYFDHDHRDDGRPDGRGLIGYRVNQASGRASDFVAIDQLYDTWFRPDLVGLSFRDERRKVVEQASRIGQVGDTLRRGLPPRVTVLDACAVDSATATGCAGARSVPAQAVTQGAMDRVTRGIKGGETAPSTTAPLLLVRYKVEELGADPSRVVPRRNEAALNAGVQVESTEGKARIERVAIPLAQGLNVVRLSAVTATGAIEGARDSSPEIRIVRAVEPPRDAAPDRVASGQTGSGQTGSGQATPGRVPSGQTTTEGAASETNARLFAVTVGVGKVAKPLPELDNAANDAIGLATTLRQDQGRLFAESHATALTDEKATRAAIIDELRAIAAKAKPDDVVVIFLAGHGKTIGGKYYFVPYDMGRHDPALPAAFANARDEAASERALDAWFQAEGLGQDQLTALIQDMQAARIAFILDTCESATVATGDALLRHDTNTTIANKIGQASGRFVLSGSFTDALDSGGDPGHGLFTSYLLRALRGEADTGRTGRIDIYQLAKFTKDNVSVKSREVNRGQEQKPAYYFAGSDFFTVRKVPVAAR